MIDQKMIPPEVVKAAMAAIDDEPFSSAPSDDLRTMRVIIAAALAAWPGMTTEPRNWRTALILPLPTEARDE